MSVFGSFWKRRKKNSRSADNPKQCSEIPHEKGNFIGQNYEVYGKLGHGGFGIVYKVYSHETRSVYALKTFRDEYLEDAETRKLFRREANLWVELERHPYIVQAYIVDKVAGRLYIAIEYIAKDEQGLNTLQDYLTHQPPDLAQSLSWAIQFCRGMEYAHSKGVRCHRDIKPSNIMISTDKTVKITDFGLAGVLGSARTGSGIRLSIQQGRVGLSGSIMEGRSCGTPTHMPPEQFTDAASCDQRSDIYAFGIVLYQMVTGGRLPFLASLPKDDSLEEQKRFARETYLLHTKAPVPKLDSPLFPIIQRCLEKQPNKRYETFKELRVDLEPLLKSQTGETVKPPEEIEFEAWEWINKGHSLNSLGRFDEAIKCYEQALEINPQNVLAWNNKGASLNSLGRFDEALGCYDQAIKIDPQDADAWYNKGVSLARLGRFDEEIKCYEQALEINLQHALAWYNKAIVEDELGRKLDATRFYRKFLELEPIQWAQLIKHARQRLRELEER
jgi:serine/threonine protein kinase